MPRRGENIHKRKDGRWEGRRKKGTDKNGKTLYAYVYGKTYGEAKEKLLSLGDISVKSACNKKLSVEDVIREWRYVNEFKIKGSTAFKYDNIIEKHILPEIGSFLISGIYLHLKNDKNGNAH